MRPRLIHKIEIKNDMVVKGRQLEGIRPVTELANYLDLVDFSDIDEVFLLDVTSSVFGIENSARQISKLVSSISLPVTFGGGVKAIEDAKKVFDTGVDRIALNSALYSQSDLLDDIATRYGNQSILASISTRFHEGNWMTFANSGRDKTLKSLATWMEDLSGRPVGEYLITSITRDGMLSGPDLALIEHVGEIGVERVLYCGGIQNLDQAREIARSEGLRGVAMSRVILDRVMLNG